MNSFPSLRRQHIVSSVVYCMPESWWKDSLWTRSDNSVSKFPKGKVLTWQVYFPSSEIFVILMTRDESLVGWLLLNSTRSAHGPNAKDRQRQKGKDSLGNPRGRMPHRKLNPASSNKPQAFFLAFSVPYTCLNPSLITEITLRRGHWCLLWAKTPISPKITPNYKNGANINWIIDITVTFSASLANCF